MAYDIKNNDNYLFNNKHLEDLAMEEKFFELINKHKMRCERYGNVARLLHVPSGVSFDVAHESTKNFGYRLWMINRLLEKIR